MNSTHYNLRNFIPNSVWVSLEKSPSLKTYENVDKLNWIHQTSKIFTHSQNLLENTAYVLHFISLPHVIKVYSGQMIPLDGRVTGCHVTQDPEVQSRCLFVCGGLKWCKVSDFFHQNIPLKISLLVSVSITNLINRAGKNSLNANEPVLSCTLCPCCRHVIQNFPCIYRNVPP